MAGEWIEYEKSLPEKPEVLRISSILNIDRFAVVGRLLEIWSWFDSHTEDGNALGVTKVFLDEKVGVTHFCDAMIESGWLVEITEPCNGLSVTNFGKHNGKSAKKRLKTNQRVAKLRNETQKKQKCNAQSVTKSVTTEQNRTEQYNTHTLTREGDQEPISEIKTPPPDNKPDDPGDWVVISGSQKHRMHDGWQPDQTELEMVCATSTVNLDEITPEIIGKVISYWTGEAVYKTPRQWCLKLIDQVKHEKLKGASNAKNSADGFKTARQSEREKNFALHASLRESVLQGFQQ